MRIGYELIGHAVGRDLKVKIKEGIEEFNYCALQLMIKAQKVLTCKSGKCFGVC